MQLSKHLLAKNYVREIKWHEDARASVDATFQEGIKECDSFVLPFQYRHDHDK